jgi:hypothetical protein
VMPVKLAGDDGNGAKNQHQGSSVVRVVSSQSVMIPVGTPLGDIFRLQNLQSI